MRHFDGLLNFDKMKQIEVNAGDLICIPADVGFGLAKVLFRSEVHIDIVRLGIFRLAVNSPGIPDHLPSDFALVLFTSCQPIKRNLWPKIGNVGVNEAERELSRYVIQGELYFEDQFLGSASPEQRKSLPRMTVWHVAYVQEQVKKICAALR